MKLRITFLQILTCLIAFSASADPAGLETNILNFPQISVDYYRPDVAVTCANAFISAGKEKACAVIEQFTEKRDRRDTDLESGIQINYNICFLCRLLFIPTNSSVPLRPPGLGAPSIGRYYSLHSPDTSEWPDLPFAIVDNIPLSLINGYALNGISEGGKSYLEYCEANGTFRSQLFPKPTSLSVSNALNKVFASPTWNAIPWNTLAHPAVTNVTQAQVTALVRRETENALMKQSEMSSNRPTGSFPFGNSNWPAE